MHRYNYELSEVVFIGDLINDKEAAQLNGIGFIGQVDGEGKDVYADCLGLPNLLGLEDTVKKVYAI